MPSKAEQRKHGGVARIRTKRLPDGTLLRIYFYNDKKSYAEKVRKRRGKAH